MLTSKADDISTHVVVIYGLLLLVIFVFITLIASFVVHATNVHLSETRQCLIADTNELVVIDVVLWIIKFVIFILAVVLWLRIVLI